MNEEGLARFANLGDSSFAIIRNGKIHHWQEAQTHYFNCPLQLSKAPAPLGLSDTAMDKPHQADLAKKQLQCVVLLYAV